MSCHCIDTYTNGYGHEVCSDCGKVMKPLDKLERKYFKTLTHWDYEEAKRTWVKDQKPHLLECENNARAAAQVAKDLARRAYHTGENNFKEFLTSEGITE